MFKPRRKRVDRVLNNFCDTAPCICYLGTAVNDGMGVIDVGGGTCFFGGKEGQICLLAIRSFSILTYVALHNAIMVCYDLNAIRLGAVGPLLRYDTSIILHALCG